MALDRIDMKILRALQNDARLSNKELAGIVGLAPSSCLERVKRLRKEKILLGSHARVDPSAVGIGLQAMIAVQLGRHSRDIVQRFHDHVAKLEPVVAVYHIAGKFDFLVHVAVRDANHLPRSRAFTDISHFSVRASAGNSRLSFAVRGCGIALLFTGGLESLGAWL